MEIFKESDLKEFKKGNLAINCQTEELAKEFLDWCESKDIMTFSSANVTLFDSYKHETCYMVAEGNEINFSGINYYIDEGYVIKEFKGFGFDTIIKNEMCRYFLDGKIIDEDLVTTINESYTDLLTVTARYFAIKSEYKDCTIEYLNLFKSELKPFGIREAIIKLEDL